MEKHPPFPPGGKISATLPRSFPVATAARNGGHDEAAGSDAQATSLPSGSALLRARSPGSGAGLPGHLAERSVVVLLCSSPGQPALPPVSTKERVEKQFWYRRLRTPASSTPGVPAEYRVSQLPAPLVRQLFLFGLGAGHLLSVVSFNFSFLFFFLNQRPLTPR